MGIASTKLVTRELALQTILSKVTQLDDEELSDVLTELVHDGFSNFRIVSDNEFEENKKAGIYRDDYIENLEDMPERNDAR